MYHYSVLTQFHLMYFKAAQPLREAPLASEETAQPGRLSAPPLARFPRSSEGFTAASPQRGVSGTHGPRKPKIR